MINIHDGVDSSDVYDNNINKWVKVNTQRSILETYTYRFGFKYYCYKRKNFQKLTNDLHL